MQSQLQIISQFSGQLLTITFEFISRCVSYQKINTSSFNVIDSIIVLYSKCSVTYLKLWEVWLKIDLLEFKILYLLWDFFLSKGQGQTFITLFSKKGVSDNAVSRFVQFQTVNVIVILKCLSLSKYRHAS